MTSADPQRSPDFVTQSPQGVYGSVNRSAIEQELIRLRRGAEVARLEAQANRLDDSADRLEFLLARIDAGETISPDQLDEFGFQSTDVARKAASSTVRFDSWDDVRKAQQLSRPIVRRDAAHGAVRAPRMKVSDPPLPSHLEESPHPRPPDAVPDETPSSSTSKGPAKEKWPAKDSQQSVGVVLSNPVVSDEHDAVAPRRRRSVAVIASAFVHAVLVLVLAGLTLSTTMPRDQVALSASVTSTSEESIETFQIETAQPTAEPTPTTPEENRVELDPLGEMAAVEVAPTMASSTNAAPALQSFGQPPSPSASSLKALQSDSPSTMQFCGVEGGGNHFVYLVDSSGSMGDAFISARRALIESIEMLTDEQRFYVIFFDAQCDYMRITRADQDESRSVKATPENKQRLKSWAMRVEMDRGKAPYEPIQYAIEKLKPDVIFLLSDGEFPQGIEDLFAQKNVKTNLFGETSPVSIVHTISYYSREGENRMRRIAENNFGQYRHIPKP